MNISALKRGSSRLVSALKRTCGRSPERLGMRLLARAERRERRVREEIAIIQAMRARAKALLGSRTRGGK